MLFSKVILASDGEMAYKLYKEELPDIILTDIKMPKVDGLNLIKQIRINDYGIPIILLTSFIEQQLVSNAMNLSIDGYLVKPIDLKKLLYTLCTAMQRSNSRGGLIPLGKDIFYNIASKELYHNDIVIDLGSKERILLLLLIKNRHKTVTKEEIGKLLWPFDSTSDSAIKGMIVRLRKKLHTDCILSVRGIGYRFNTMMAKK